MVFSSGFMTNLDCKLLDRKVYKWRFDGGQWVSSNFTFFNFFAAYAVTKAQNPQFAPIETDRDILRKLIILVFSVKNS